MDQTAPRRAALLIGIMRGNATRNGVHANLSMLVWGSVTTQSIVVTSKLRSKAVYKRTEEQAGSSAV